MFMQDISRFTATSVAPVASVSTGIVAGTLIETSTGWTRIETLRLGDLVQTVDGGLRPVRALNRHWMHPADTARLICVPGGSFDNCADLYLPPDQDLLIDLDDDDGFPDALTALIPAKSLLGHAGIHSVQQRHAIEILAPLFDEEEGLWAASGIRLHCPGISRQDDFFTRLTLAETRLFLARRNSLYRAA